MNDLLRELLSMGPAFGAGLAGNGNAMQAFMEGFQKSRQQWEQSQRQKQQDQIAADDRTRLVERQNTTDANAKADRERAATLAKQQDALRVIELPQKLAAGASGAETPEDAKRLIESMMPTMMSAFGQESMAFGQPAVEQATQAITGRQKKQVEAFVESVLKVEHVANNPDADPEIVNLPAHIQKSLGKDSAKLNELRRFAMLPVGKPPKRPSQEVSLQSKEMMVGGKRTPVNFNPKTGTYTNQSGLPVVVDAVPPRPTAGSDPEIAELRKELLRLQVERAGQKPEPNQAQFTSAGYAGRMEQAEPILTQVAPSITAMSLPKFEMQTNSWFARPTFQSPHVQSYMQAARNFINAVLRRESGAVISPTEFAEARLQYLPVAGDDPAALAQKAANRAYVFRTMKRSSGHAYEPPVKPPTAGSGQIIVTAPDGSRHSFETQAQADAFKKLAGIK